MQSRPLYRWKSFWLGVLALGFLGWAWGESLDRSHSANFRIQSQRVWSFANSEGCVAWAIQTYPSMMTPNQASFATREHGDWAGPAFQSLSYRKAEPMPGFRVTHLRVPHWLLVILVAIAWVTLLASRLNSQRSGRRVS